MEFERAFDGDRLRWIDRLNRIQLKLERVIVLNELLERDYPPFALRARLRVARARQQLAQVVIELDELEGLLPDAGDRKQLS